MAYFRMILFNHMAKTGADCGLQAGMIVSVAWNVFESVDSLETPGVNKHVLNWALAKGLVANFKRLVKIDIVKTCRASTLFG